MSVNSTQISAKIYLRRTFIYWNSKFWRSVWQMFTEIASLVKFDRFWKEVWWTCALFCRNW